MTDTTTEINSAPPVVSAQTAMRDAKLKQACADFESILVYYVLNSMRKSLPKNELFGNSEGQKIYKSMADQAMSENIARGRGMGLGELLYNQLTRSVR